MRRESPISPSPPRKPTPKLQAPVWSIYAVLAALASVSLIAAENPPQLPEGEAIYRRACATCHGPDGRGASRELVGFDNPLPDFTDCRFAQREADQDWIAIVHDGGPARGFSEIMPAFGETLKREEIEHLVRYLRGFCREPDWPRGELNLPRPLVTEKAFPEDEVVLTTVFLREGTASVIQRVTYERRIGARNQLELTLPYTFRESGSGGWFGGIGDIAAGWKRVLFANLSHGAIASLTGEFVIPTGSRSRGLGKGVTVFETFGTYGQLLPKDSFLQLQAGVELPMDSSKAARAAFWRVATGKMLVERQGRGRLWAPMVEFLAERELVRGEPVVWDVLPELHVTLSRRQHVRANFGVRIPATHREGRSVQLVFYLLWDWYDGGLREGW